jgi:hypothetical protein
MKIRSDLYMADTPYPFSVCEDVNAMADNTAEKPYPFSVCSQCCTGGGGGEGGPLQSKTVTPTKEQIKVTPDSEYYGLSDVTVEAIPDEYQDVSMVSVTPDKILDGYAYADMTGMCNGTMPDNGDVSAEIDGVNNTSVTIPAGYTSGGTVAYIGSGGDGGSGINPEWTDWRNFSFYDNRNSLVAKLKFTDTSAGTNFADFLKGCDELTEIPKIDTGKGDTFTATFSGCTSLKKIPVLSFDKSNIQVFIDNSNLTFSISVYLKCHLNLFNSTKFWSASIIFLKIS